MWANAPCAWIAKYLLDRKFSFSNAAKAGTLAEEAVVKILAHGQSEETAITEAMAEYNRACLFGCSDADTKRGAAIPGMIQQAVDQLKQYGEPDMNCDLIYGKRQHKATMLCKGDNWDLPVEGYLDFYYPKQGLIIDLKTTMRLPSQMSDEHLRQGAFYKGAFGNHGVRFLYVSGKNHVWHEVAEPGPILNEFKTILTRQERFLRLGSAELLQSIVPVVSDSFYWSGDETIRQELYGI
jgi:hypothetical protein